MKTTKSRYYADNNYQAYVVFIGRRPGIYFDWNSTKAQVHRFSGCKYKGFKSKQEATNAYSLWKDEQFKSNQPVSKASKQKEKSNPRRIDNIYEDLPWK